MQVSHISTEQLADMLVEGSSLATVDYSQRVEVLHWGGVDLVVIICPMTGDAVVVSPCSEDKHSGGSIHHHARQMLDD